MEKYCVMLSGPTITNDDKLVSELQKSVLVLTNSDNGRIESVMQNSRIDLILFEISENNNHDVEMIGNIKNQFPNIPIIVMNGDGNNELMVKAFSYGVIDAFKKPYKHYLIVERVNAIFRRL
ncbi:MAG: response regulator [bacterium]|nr:MAG: response regulator [bacterium]